MTGSTYSRAKRRCQDSDFTPSGQKVDNSVTTLEKLFELYRQAELCDVQLQVGSCLFHVHKLILSMSSDVFKTMLTDAKWPDARKACIMLSEEPECVEVFGEFLQYMYTGSIHLTNASVLPVLTLADKYNIHDLGRECKHYMASHCHAALPDLKVVSWLQYAMLCNDKSLELTVRHYMELNFNHVMQSEDFLTMRLDVLEELLNCPRLVINSEFALFTCLKNWFLHSLGSSAVGELVGTRDRVSDPCCTSETSIKSRQTIEKTFLHLMSHVRLPVMKRAQLLAVYSDPLVLQYTDLFPHRLEGALSVSVCPQHKERHCTCGTGDNISTSEESSMHYQNWRLNISANPGPSCSRTVCRQRSVSSMVHLRHEDLSERLSTVDGLHSTEHVVGLANKLGRKQPVSSSAQKGEGSHQTGSVSDVVVASVMCCPFSGRENSVHCTPRNYTCDDWSTFLTIEEFSSFPCYGSQAYFFSTPASAVLSSSSSNKLESHEDMEDSSLLEWQAELYPRGVRFPRAKMIGIPDNYDIDESCRDVVRLAINSKTHHHKPCRVEVIVLAVACGLADGTEYVETLTQRSCIFDEEHTVHNIDNIVPFWELNCLGSRYLTDSVLFPGKKDSSFKLVVIIKPTVGTNQCLV